MNTAEQTAWLYVTQVMHQRRFPVAYRFVYPVFSLLVDIDRLEEISSASRVFSFGRFNLLSLHTRDHGPRDGRAWRPWVEAKLAEHGIRLQGGSIRLLFMPRVLGYAFNPLSVWFCHHRDGSLRAVICEVSNTFGEHHHYLLHDAGRAMPSPVRQRRDKVFHVSPFIDMDTEYRFRISVPDGKLRVLIHEYRQNELMLIATQTGDVRPFTDAQLLRTWLRMPLMTFKVITMIHWQALKIWLKGGRFHSKPAPPREEMT
ncbi:hypothetical protein B1C78_08580 [Thioalkalivibrio denitrificans]|uniref:DUF1365 domain-containing protein n=1 Tax=Thioalkalivibrio denitrificans TaxID=108003 RepID=A0A1V3NHG3_9GAMM|nr:DUF1365 domain-containing protein [Thioalkalivibrio denitrificans]OOG24549.1 hypothetical protein B1C78_08580 [Thioalkalivibrio denitrificans]